MLSPHPTEEEEEEDEEFEGEEEDDLVDEGMFTLVFEINSPQELP